jgi:phosphate:Na+ symporter
MVQSGIPRAFGSDLRRILGIALRNRFTAFLAGGGVTALLQSSTATALMTATFVGDGLVGLVPALAIMLGANVGTTLIVQVFSFDIASVAPLLLVIGVISFKYSARTRIRDLCRVAIGLGLMLLSLHILLDTLAPAEDAPNVRVLLSAMTGMPVLNVAFGAILAWAAHSSLAVVLLVMSLAYSNFITPIVAFALVIGANLGSAINPRVEGGGLNNPVARRLPLGNLINRVVGCALDPMFAADLKGGPSLDMQRCEG